MIKNRSKIAAIIENARLCRKIIKENGAIKSWIRSILARNAKAPLFNPSVRDEMQVFSKIGHKTSRWLAYVVTRDKKLLDEE